MIMDTGTDHALVWKGGLRSDNGVEVPHPPPPLLVACGPASPQRNPQCPSLTPPGKSTSEVDLFYMYTSMLRTSQPDPLLTTYLFLLCKIFKEVNQLGLEFIVLWEGGRRGGEGGDWDLTAPVHWGYKCSRWKASTCCTRSSWEERAAMPASSVVGRAWALASYAATVSSSLRRYRVWVEV